MHSPCRNTASEKFGARLDTRDNAFFIWLFGAYVALHFLLRIVFSPAIGTDDVTQAIHAQVLAWGYEFRQPPLYTWLQWGSDRLLGVGVASHAFLKYLLLFLTYVFLYLIGRAIYARQGTAVIAAASLWLTYPFAVSIHQGVTHSILLSALIAASVWAFIRMERQPSLPAYLGLGVLLGLGIFSKYGFLVFAAAFLLAALSLPRFRRVVLDRRMLLAAAVVILIALPPLLWLIERQTATLAAAAALGPKTAQASSFLPRLTNLYSLASAIVQFLAPLWLFLLVFFPKALRRTLNAGPADDHMRLLGRTIFISLAMLAAAMLAGLLGKVQPRWMHAFLLLFPLYFFARAEKAYVEGVARPGYLATLVAIPVLAIALWAGQIYLGPSLGKATRFHAPYDLLAAHLREEELHPGLIIAGDEYLGGNLRLNFPEARVIAARLPFAPPADAKGSCLVIWNAGTEGDALPQRLEKFLADPASMSKEAVRVWKGLYHHSGRDFLEAAYLPLPREQCRTGPE